MGQANREASSQTSRSTLRLYVETSALAAALLEGDRSIIQTLARSDDYITSALTFVETRRAIIRAGVDRRLNAIEQQTTLRELEEFERRCTVISITPVILERAGKPFPVETVRTLDAIHLATIEVMAGAPAPTTVLSRDVRVCENAKALGFVIA
jgi:predicted nucleic acid-binding protein